MTKEIDILSFNTVEEANKGDWCKLEKGGKEVGIELLVFGDDSDQVQEHQKAKLKDYSRKRIHAEKRGKLEDFEAGLVDSLKERTVETALIRIGNWKGAKGDYNQADMKIALTNNPEWVDQVVEFSNRVGK